MTRLSIFAASLATTIIMTGAASAAILTHVPQRHPKPQVTTYRCEEQLGHLRRVFEEELKQVREANHVGIVTVCMGEDFGMMRSAGNAGALRSGIANNPALRQALADKAFRPDDVVGIRMTGDDKVLLYVHPFHH